MFSEKHYLYARIGLPPVLAEFSSPRVVRRSYNNSNTNGGVAYANANNASSDTNTNIGSRLANGKIKAQDCFSVQSFGRYSEPTVTADVSATSASRKMSHAKPVIFKNRRQNIT